MSYSTRCGSGRYNDVQVAALVGGQHVKNGAPGVEPSKKFNLEPAMTFGRITHIASMVLAYTASRRTHER